MLKRPCFVQIGWSAGVVQELFFNSWNDGFLQHSSIPARRYCFVCILAGLKKEFFYEDPDYRRCWLSWFGHGPAFSGGRA
jgi:hypothetical protein